MPKKPKNTDTIGSKPVVCHAGKPCKICDGIVTVARPIKTT